MKIKHNSDHAKARAAQYPPIEEQLDMLWHAMNNGVLPKAGPFYTTLQKVKQLHPKVT
ncbi:hypothetical protein G7009_00885 [Pseudomonas capeferrum]|uniref:hypothetical protein n=1 Tax=Pseudomonas capeferrum TaxID=1495066 RepID=UPI0015E26FFB|nr:hypothetical protein [Pseudomonas capeferrum]MBA1200360.1 hypothetical protein [Pseudomonas capeferrum]